MVSVELASGAVPPLEIESSIAARNAWLDQALNADGGLPLVKLEQAHYDRNHYMISSPAYQPHGDEPFGFVTLRRLGSERPYTTAAAMHIHSAVAGKGIGRAMMLEVMKNLPLGEGLQSGDAQADTLTEDSYRLWQFLEACGVAVCDIPPDQAAPEQDGPYRGLYYQVRFRTVFGRDAEPEAAAEVMLPEPGVGRLTRVLRRLGFQN